MVKVNETYVALISALILVFHFTILLQKAVSLQRDIILLLVKSPLHDMNVMVYHYGEKTSDDVLILIPLMRFIPQLKSWGFPAWTPLILSATFI